MMCAGVMLGVAACGSSATIRDAQPQVSTDGTQATPSGSTASSPIDSTPPSTTSPAPAASDGSAATNASQTPIPESAAPSAGTAATSVSTTISVPILTDLVIDRGIVDTLDQLLATSAPTVYGGVTGDDTTGLATVYITTVDESATAIVNLKPYVDTARAKVAGFGPHPPYPDLHIQLIRSSSSYVDYTALYQGVTNEPWTIDVAHRVVNLSTDYANQQVDVGILDRIDQDVARAAITFGHHVRVDDAGPSIGPDKLAYWQYAPSFSPTPESTTLELLVSENACAGGQSATGRITPNVVYTATTVTITINVRELGGPQSCVASAPTPYTLQLPEPIGNREIVGAATDS